MRQRSHYYEEGLCGLAEGMREVAWSRRRPFLARLSLKRFWQISVSDLDFLKIGGEKRLSEGQNTGFDGMLKSILDNPDMFKKALDMAQNLSQSGVLDSIMHAEGFSPGKEKGDDKNFGEILGENLGEKFSDDSETGYGKMAFADRATDRHGVGISDRHRKLLEVLKLYVADDKREKLDLVIKLIDLMSTAKHLGF